MYDCLDPGTAFIVFVLMNDDDGDDDNGWDLTQHLIKTVGNGTTSIDSKGHSQDLGKTINAMHSFHSISLPSVTLYEIVRQLSNQYKMWLWRI